MNFTKTFFLLLTTISFSAWAQDGKTVIKSKPKEVVTWERGNDIPETNSDGTAVSNGIHQPNIMIDDMQVQMYNGQEVMLPTAVGKVLYLDFLIAPPNYFDVYLFGAGSLFISQNRYTQNNNMETLTLKMADLAPGQYSVMLLCAQKNIKLTYKFNKVE